MESLVTVLFSMLFGTEQNRYRPMHFDTILSIEKMFSSKSVSTGSVPNLPLIFLGKFFRIILPLSYNKCPSKCQISTALKKVLLDKYDISLKKFFALSRHII